MREDAERVSERFCQVAEALDWEIDDERLEEVFLELLRAEVIFPGPSLYASA